ncbi:hypothetical protein PybrP1_008138 [[Pythium] brassicae (nom. inval.)]|nr:hypothetical protein PybrP1_008138 [[Pythium] brassicae (nom. inval.)]
MYITDLNKILRKYPCPKCTMFFTTHESLETTLIIVVRRLSLNASFQHQRDTDQKETSAKDYSRNDRTRHTHDHAPISVSTVDSLTKEAKCFVNESPRQLLVDMFGYVYTRQKTIAKHNRTKLNTLIGLLSFKGHTLKNIVPDKQNHYLKMLSKVLEFCDQIPLIGFNSGRYDINLIKRDLFAVLGAESINFTVKNPSYMCIATDKLRLLDISNYLPAGTSYDEYLKTYTKGCQCEDKIRCLCGVSKGLFCYEYIDSCGRINETSLPPREAFESGLKKTKYSE